MVPHTAQSPRDFVDIIQAFLQQADFPFEPPAHRRAFKIDQTRDWSIDFDLINSFVAPLSLLARVYGVGLKFDLRGSLLRSQGKPSCKRLFLSI